MKGVRPAPGARYWVSCHRSAADGTFSAGFRLHTFVSRTVSRRVFSVR